MKNFDNILRQKLDIVNGKYNMEGVYINYNDRMQRHHMWIWNEVDKKSITSSRSSYVFPHNFLVYYSFPLFSS